LMRVLRYTSELSQLVTKYHDLARAQKAPASAEAPSEL
jgi:hypothetical protein